MRPTLSWADLTGARVGVWGLGVEGRANIGRLARAGVVPVLVDDRGSEAAPDLAVLATGDGGLDALAACEVVVKSPGISRYGPACAALVDAGVAVVGGLGLWLEEVDRTRVLCTTGTKGKSTTTAIVGHLLVRWGYRVVMGGNIGRPPWDPSVPTDADWWAIEVSSYQATDVSTGPPVVAVTSLHADHLTWHGDEAAYQRDKLSLCTRPGVRVTVANGGDEGLRARRDLLGPNVRWVGPADGARVPEVGRADWIDRLALVGAHNRANAAVARVALVELGVPEAGSEDALAAGAAGFAGLESRLQSVASLGGVEFVDDGLSTNVLPTLAAVASYPGRRVALLVGGQDRGIDYAPLARGLHHRTDPTLVVAMPDNGDRIAAALAADPAPAVAWDRVGDLEEGVRRAYEWARPDGVVLLSPAAPSFGRFRDYRHRAEVFTAVAKGLIG
jgi:UDP-N-acetylmuramoylalanine--D-glutamate ligase